MKCVHKLEHMEGKQHNNKENKFQHTKNYTWNPPKCILKKGVNAVGIQESKKISMPMLLYDK